jgi:type III restriction enzyme
MPEVLAYVKNYNLGFTIPYTLNDQVRQYNPDYLVRVDDGRGAADPLNLIVEVTGEKKKDKEAKVETARRLWVPAINNDGRFGRWAFLEVQDPWNAQTEIRALLKAMGAGRAA